MLRKILLTGWLILLAFEIYFLLYVIHDLHWYGPVQDFWGSIPFIEKTLQSGDWFGADLWAVQNSHRLALPRLAFLADYYYFHGSNYFLTGFSVLILLGEIAVFYFLVKGNSEKWLIALSVLSVLLLPPISYNLLNTFNIQWIQCAFLALAACAAYSYGLGSARNVWVISGILLAILCCFTTFTLAAIWPALFLLLWLHRAPKKQWFSLGIICFIFIPVFIWMLPVDAAFGNGGQYHLPPLLDAVVKSDKPVTMLFMMPVVLLHYLVSYLSLPVEESWKIASYGVTAISLLWLAISLFRHPKYLTQWQISSLLSIMFFVVCLALSTGLGRVFMGELSYGIRFHPVVLLYWAACLSHVMICVQLPGKPPIFFVASALSLLMLWGLGIYTADKTGSRLAEEHNRYVRMQMAYLTDNLHPNALYENLVPEWRASSYPVILAAIPYLQQQKKGIFRQDAGRFLDHGIDQQKMANCLNVSLQEKPRNDDTNIRNMTFRNPDPASGFLYPYLFIYSGKQVIGATFQQRYAFFDREKKDKESIWIGMSGKPLDLAANMMVVALAGSGYCRVNVVD